MKSADRRTYELPFRSKASRRLLLVALLALSPLMPLTFEARSAQAAPMIDGIDPCTDKDGDNRPSMRNPNPLGECQPGFARERLPAGDPTAEYLRTYYPNGIGNGPVQFTDAQSGLITPEP